MIAFDHRPLRLLDAVRLSLRDVRLSVAGSRAWIALAGSLAITAGVDGILALRLHAARAELSADYVRLDQTTAAAGPAQRLLRRIGEIRAVADDVTRARHSGDRAADELARLGNAVPSHVWIAHVRRDGSELAVDGGAGSVAAVGSALNSLTGPHARVQLVGLKDAARPGAVADIRYSLRIDER